MPSSLFGANDLRASSALIALDIGGTKIAGAVVRYESAGAPPTLDHVCSVPTDAARGGAAVRETVVHLARQLAEEAGAAGLLGVGVGTAGCVDPATGAIAFANDLMPGWTGQPLAARLQEALGLPAAVMGDVHAYALGETRWGAARTAESCLLVASGTGLGGAYVANGTVLRGFHGAGGHLGHSLHPAAAGLPCSCGHVGHVEAVTSGTGIAALYQERTLTDELDPSLLGDAVAARAALGEEKARAVIEFAGYALGEAIGSWCNIFDPQMVIISGSVAKAGSLWRTALAEGFAAQVMAPLADTPIIDAQLGSQAPLIGAAENLLDTLEGRSHD